MMHALHDVVRSGHLNPTSNWRVAQPIDCVLRLGSSALWALEPNLKPVVVAHASTCVEPTLVDEQISYKCLTWKMIY